MGIIDIVQGFYQPVRHNISRKVFGSMLPSVSVGDLVTEEGDYIKVNQRPFGKPVAIKLLGSPKKVDAMFKVFSWFGGVSFHKFFTFEFICMLEEIRLGRFRYDIDMEVVEKCLEYFLGNMNTFQEVHDIDRKRIKEVFYVEPLEHQNEMIAKYMQYKYIQKYRGMLAHAAAGVGKTATSLFVMEGLHKEVKNVIILCPLQTVNDVWKRTLGEENYIFKKSQDYWFVLDKKPYNGEKYIICHYEGLEKIMPLKLPKETTAMIIDECHNLNDPKSKRSQLAIECANKFEMQNVFMLSGTPIKSGFRELGLLFKFLDRNFTKEAEKRYLTLYATATEFLTRVLYERYDGYTVKVTKDAIKLDPLTTVNLKVNIPEKEMEKYYLVNIKEELKDFVARRTKELKDQEEYWTETYLRLREKAKEASGVNAFSYADYVKDVDAIRKANKFQYGQMPDLLERVNKFEKNNLLPALVGEDRHLFREAKTVYKYPELKIQGEALANVIGKSRINCHILLAEYLDFKAIISSSKKKTIIFSNYTDVCKAAEQICKNLGYSPICVFGEETKNLASNVDKFLNSKNINPLITTYKSLSTGVPLTAADTIICLDMPFRMYVYEQAVARAWRLGQDSQVFSYIVEANTEVPNINSRNIDIITWYKEEVEKITGISSSVGLKGDSLETGESISVEEFNLSVEDIDLNREGVLDWAHRQVYKNTWCLIHKGGELELPTLTSGPGGWKLDFDETEFKGLDIGSILDYTINASEDHYDKGVFGYHRIEEESKGDIKKYIDNIRNSMKVNIDRLKSIEKYIDSAKPGNEYSVFKRDDFKSQNDVKNYIQKARDNCNPHIDAFLYDNDLEEMTNSEKEYQKYFDIITDILKPLNKHIERVMNKYLDKLLKDVKIIKYTEWLDMKEKEKNLSKEDLNISTEAINPKRQAVQDFIIKYIGKIVSGNQNTDLYKQMFNKMSDQEFEEFMIKLRDGKIHLSVIIPHGMKDIKVDVENNMKVAKELGFDFYQRLKITGSNNMPDYMTPNKYLVLKLPVKRASQLLSKKISIPRDNKSRDLLTGQVTGDSKAAKLTNPEVQILLGLGLDSSIKELMKFRGGDLGAGNAMNNDLMRYGRATQERSGQFSSGVVSTKSLKQFLQAMHIRSTL